MNDGFFHFSEPPFSNTPDPKFFFPTSTHRQALERLLDGIVEKKGFLLLTGDVGTGKTTLCRTLLKRLDGKVDTALVLNSDLSDEEILQVILKDFGLPTGGTSKFDLMELLYEFLVERACMGRDTLIVIDDAQNLPRRSMEQVRMISNFETEKRKLVQVLLVGQQEMVEKLDRPEFRQFKQRIAVRASLRRLSPAETTAYVDHRLSVAGNHGKASLFTDRALAAIHRATHGYPRSVNTLCDHLLAAATRRGLKVIDAGLVRQTVNVTGLKNARRIRFPRGMKELRWAAACACLIFVAGLGTLAALRQPSHDHAAGRMPDPVLQAKLAEMESSLATLAKLIERPQDPENDLERKLTAARAEAEDLRLELAAREEELQGLSQGLERARTAESAQDAASAESAPVPLRNQETGLRKRIRELQKESRRKADDIKALEEQLDGIRMKLRETLHEKEQLARDLVESRENVASAAKAGSDVSDSLLIAQLKEENDELRRAKRLVETIAARTIKSQGHEILRLTRERETLMKNTRGNKAPDSASGEGETSMISYPPEER